VAPSGISVLVEPAAVDQGLLEQVEVSDWEAESIRQLGCRSHLSSPIPRRRP
jgi:hypothetical protein